MPIQQQTNVLQLSANVVLRPAVSITKVTINRIVDEPKAKRIVAYLQEFAGPLILWQGNEYDAIGDWTQSQADTRIISLVKGL